MTVPTLARSIGDDDYRRLLELRTGLLRFLRWSEEQAEMAGVSPSQHQLLLTVRGSRGLGGATIGDVADALLLRHNSAVELVDRAELLGLVRRKRDLHDARVVRLALTTRGEKILDALSERHLEELARLARQIGPLLAGLDKEARTG